MKSPMETLNDLEEVIREIHKLDSKMLAGQFIPAWRDLRKLLAFFEEKKTELIKESKGENEKQHS